MKIKYTGLYENINICLIEYNYFKQFHRNDWTEVPEKIADILLKEEYFLCEKDMEFTNVAFNTPTKVIPNKTPEDKRYKLAIIRFGALGDLIMLLPVARYLRRVYNFNITLCTQGRFVEQIKRAKDAFDSVIVVNDYRKSNFDKTVCLDGVLEQDHSLTNHERLVHRTILYERFFNIKIDNYDFSLPVTKEEFLYAENILNANDK